jgi:hypothetical protein
MRRKQSNDSNVLSEPPAPSKPAVYLAECSYDRKQARELLEGELKRLDQDARQNLRVPTGPRVSPDWRAPGPSRAKRSPHWCAIVPNAPARSSHTKWPPRRLGG